MVGKLFERSFIWVVSWHSSSNRLEITVIQRKPLFFYPYGVSLKKVCWQFHDYQNDRRFCPIAFKFSVMSKLCVYWYRFNFCENRKFFTMVFACSFTNPHPNSWKMMQFQKNSLFLNYLGSHPVYFFGRGH